MQKPIPFAALKRSSNTIHGILVFGIFNALGFVGLGRTRVNNKPILFLDQAWSFNMVCTC
jgi:hypothetical protein